MATDCLFILKVAVGASDCEPICICDVTGNGDAPNASDSLLCLQAAVGGGDGLACDCSVVTTTTTLPLPRTWDVTFGVLNYESFSTLAVFIDYATSGGEFLGSYKNVECEPLLLADFVDFNDDEPPKHLNLTFVDAYIFSSPTPLARCAFVSRYRPTDEFFGYSFYATRPVPDDSRVDVVIGIIDATPR
ncbi:MAG: hypothetical protein E4H01_05235 [Lysobacterales bacterium]|nr:MAG: hypothetical protein E4H01_05235 [Xanthomonadales bacterium]